MNEAHTTQKLLLILLAILILKEALAAVVTASVTIGNPAPVVTNMIFLDNPVALIENSLTTVWCNATINDTNGWQDITSVSGVIWNSNTTYNASNNYNNHYTNSSCALYAGSGTSRAASCAFGMYYFADPGRNWTCRITAMDSTNQQGYNETNFSVSAFLGISVSPEINFGTLNPGSTSNTSISTYVNNTCNQQIDLKMNALSNITCNVGAIEADYVHYNTTNTDYSSMCLLTTNADETCGEVQNNFNLGKCTAISGIPINPTKNLYWKIQVPLGVRGTCYTNLTVTAKEG